MPTRKATATWEGGLQKGKGSFQGESGQIAGQYSFGSRFGDTGGTNPEELLAAAEAACFSMALSLGLEKAGHTPQRIDTQAACTIEKQGDGFTITSMRLTTRARVSGISNDDFQKIAQATKDGCPVSKALKGNLQLDVTATLE